MRIKVLMVGSGVELGADAELLRDRGFMVYTCKDETVNEMVNEIQPNVVFIGQDEENENKGISTYNALVNNISFSHYPVIYTLAEDDMYLVNRKRSPRNSRTIISDNLVDSIKTALTGTRILQTNTKELKLPYYPTRA